MGFVNRQLRVANPPENLDHTRTERSEGRDFPGEENQPARVRPKKLPP